MRPRRYPQPVPGDADTYRGVDLIYKKAAAMLGRTLLPLRLGKTPAGPIPAHPAGTLYAALPATFIPILQGGQGKPPIATPRKYKGMAPSSLFPLIEETPPWER